MGNGKSSLSCQATKATAGRTAEVGTKLAVPPSSWEGLPLSHRWRHPLTPQIHFVVVVTFCLRWAMGLFVTLRSWLASSLWQPSYLNFPACFFLLFARQPSCPALSTPRGWCSSLAAYECSPTTGSPTEAAEARLRQNFLSKPITSVVFFFLVPLSIWSSSLAYDTGTVAVIVCSALFRT